MALTPELLFVDNLPGASTVANTHRMAYWLWQDPACANPQHVVVCVHGLTRQGRDFDVLAQALSKHCTVVCTDVVGRGHSDWLSEPMQYAVPTYASDHMALIAQLTKQHGAASLDWVGTSMGGLIGMAVAALPDGVLALPVRKLVLNDVGPALSFEGLARIGAYVGKSPPFASVQDAADAMRVLASGFGPHTPQQWLDLSRPMLRAQGEQFVLHYDPSIAKAFESLSAPGARDAVAQGEAALWAAYDAIRAPTLLLRGADSDLLTQHTAQDMTQRGPRAQLHVFQGVGHAPTLIAPDQQAAVVQFLVDLP
jgi:pimeloyl-ACP methyl ester carboxylesterase